MTFERIPEGASERERLERHQRMGEAQLKRGNLSNEARSLLVERQQNREEIIRHQYVFAIIGLGAAAFFLSPNITGNAVANLGKSSSNLIGIILLVAGLIACYYYSKK